MAPFEYSRGRILRSLASESKRRSPFTQPVALTPVREVRVFKKSGSLGRCSGLRLARYSRIFGLLRTKAPKICVLSPGEEALLALAFRRGLHQYLN